MDYDKNTGVARKYREELPSIKKKIESSNIYFRKNNARFNKFTKFVFQTALSPADEDNLRALGKPIIEFNFLNAFISRLCGEYSKQEPSITVMSEFGEPVNPDVIKVLEGHIRHIMFEANKVNTQYNIYKHQLAGGFTVMKVWTEYAHEMSMDQVIKFGEVYEPTLCGFDPMARNPCKDDGEYCFELFPMPKERFIEEYPKVDISDMNFGMGNEGFSWSYNIADRDVVVVCDFYKKKHRKFKIVKLVDGKVMKLKDYEEFVTRWHELGITEQPPAIIGKPRETMLDVVCRYRVCGVDVIDYKETDFKYLPLIFVDGDSVIIRDSDSSTFEQFTKPYVYHAEGIQRLTNFSGQVIANDFENMVMHKFKVAKESLPQEEEYLEAYKNMQIGSTFVYQAFMDGDPDKPNPPPMEIQRVPLPAEVVATFTGSMQMTQNILGTYDAALGINSNQLSGIAIVEAATQSNAAAMPYVVSNIQALNHLANVFIDLIPKYYVTPMTIPIMDREGNRQFVKVNQPNGISFNYDENALSVRVEAGPNFAIQKSKALAQVAEMSQSSELFAKFMADEGLDFYLDNMEFKGSDILAERAKVWMQQQKEMAAKQAQQPDPMMLQQINEAKRIEQKDKEMMMDYNIKSGQVINDRIANDNERINIMVKAGESRDKLLMTIAKAHAEEERARADLGIKHAKTEHDKLMDIHDRLNEKKESKNEKSSKKSS